jgi:LmbE family N-acetylglucosaminyl deacetylase
VSILAVVAHPDDEVLGCGGSIAAAVGRGEPVDVLCLAHGGRRSELERSCEELGVRAAIANDFPDQLLDTVPLVELIHAIETVAAASSPDVVLLHHAGDLNLDHAIVARATMTAFRPAGQRAADLLAFETLSSTEWSPATFAPTGFVEVGMDEIDVALSALRCYSSQLRDRPHPRNAAGMLTRWRYRGHQAGVAFAEAYDVVRATV